MAAAVRAAYVRAVEDIGDGHLRDASCSGSVVRADTQLHDSLAQQLFTIGVTAERRRTEEDPARLRAALRDIELMAARAGRELRAARLDAEEAAVANGFELELHREARAIARRAGSRVAVTRDGTPIRPRAEVRDLLLDTAREVLGVVVERRRARLAVAHIRYARGSIALSLQGEGPLLATAACDLATLRARAVGLRGTLEETPDAGGVPVVRLELPTGEVD
ncbi:MAG: hypothetical protein QOD44_340 [Solirubrobacteraceae bacterium]|nr:hypothetical protein [Solirubrobacteraceae bacterium]MEA2316151.1 hypothetical protein [Solirubrobacteraceae bacterium]